MRAVNQRLEIPAPAIFWVQSLPISAERRKDDSVPYYLPILEEVQVDGAALEVNRIEGLGAARLDVDGLLFRSSCQLAASDLKTLLRGVLHQLAGIQQERRLFVAETHFGPPVNCLMVSSLSLEPRVVPNSKE